MTNEITRRAKLRAVFEAYATEGATAADLLDSIDAFTAAGKSGIENWLNEEYAALVEVPSTSDVSNAVYALKQALAFLQD